jgi:hypothetical protein
MMTRPTAWALLCACLAGCVERELTIDSDPPGALVYLNDQEVGRTPVRREFTWYGTYDVAVRKEGYRTLKTQSPVIAPPWLWVPLDLVMELLPFPVQDRHRLHYTLKPETEADVDPQQIIQRAQELKTRLEGKGTTRPATQPQTQPGTQPDTQAATQPLTNPESRPTTR